jgi:hypothetical protein
MPGWGSIYDGGGYCLHAMAVVCDALLVICLWGLFVVEFWGHTYTCMSAHLHSVSADDMSEWVRRGCLKP